MSSGRKDSAVSCLNSEIFYRYNLLFTIKNRDQFLSNS
jgi:hypothetical protein